MNQSTKEAYAEVDEILNLMDKKYVEEVPVKLRKIFSENKLKGFIKTIMPNKPLEEQNLSKETLAILAVLNYNYWCKDEEKKKQLMEQYSNNEKKYQEELREIYSADNLFKSKLTQDQKEICEEKQVNTHMVEYKKPKWYKRIFDKILKIFKRKKDTFNSLEDNKEMSNSETIVNQMNFLESVKVKNNNSILALQKELKQKQIEISDLTNIELEEMIKLYKKQIETKREKLKEFRSKMLLNKKVV